MQIEGVSRKMGLPLARNLVEPFGGEVGLNAVLSSGGFGRSFEMLDGGGDCLFEGIESGEEVEAEAKLEPATQQHTILLQQNLITNIQFKSSHHYHSLWCSVK